MKRVFESGASKRKKRILKDEAVKKTRIITLFALFAQQSHSPQSQEALVTQSNGPSVNSDISLTAVTEVHSTACLDTGNKSEICTKFLEKEQTIEEIAEDLTLREQTNPGDIMTASATNLNSLVELDIGTIDKATQMDLFLAFFIADKSNANQSSFSAQSGWNILRGWRKLKDKMLSHENSTLHKENYVTWKLACKVARVKKSVDYLLLTELSAESSYWMKILRRILDDVLFLSERGLAFFGSSNDIGDPENGKF